MKFSILIPAYKSKFLSEAIDSILSQTYKDFEIIIVDDNSPENLFEIVSRYNDKRIHYFKNKSNCGAINVVDNWNICLGYATGDYVLCMGDDDMLLSNCLQSYYDLINDYPDLGVYHARTLIIDENSEIVDIQEPRPVYENVYSMLYNRLNGRRQFIGDFLFNTRRLRANGGFYKLPLAWGSDDISVYIAAKKNGIANMQECGFLYRVNSLTISNGGYIHEKLVCLNLEEAWYKNLLDSFSPINVEEEVYYNKLCKNSNLLKKKRVFLLKEYCTSNGFLSSLLLLKHKEKYKIGFKEYAYAILLSVMKK